MKQESQNQLLKSIEHLSEEEKLALFNVEELESRLEMAAPGRGPGQSPTAELITDNSVCWIGN